MITDPIHALKTLKRATITGVGIAAIAFAGYAAAASDMPENYTPPEQYTWSAEFIDFDASRNLITVRSRLATEREIAETAQLHRGDEVFLTWSGLRFANSVRAIHRNAADAPSALTIPVEFGQLEGNGRYVTFSVEIPESSASDVASLGVGNWVTGTSPSYPFDSQEAVVSIRPYNDVE